MPADTCSSHLFSSYPHCYSRGLSEKMKLMIGQTSNIKQEREDTNENSGGEEKEFNDKWEQIRQEKKLLPLVESETVPHHLHYPPNSILAQHSQTEHNQHHHIPDEGTQDSQDNLEGSITPTASNWSVSSSCSESPKETSSFLFVGPLGKKRKYSRQRATSDDNESESHPPTAAGSPEMLEEEMDESESPISRENLQSNMGGQDCDNSSPHDKSSLGEPVSTIVSTSRIQSTSPESSTELPGEPHMGTTIVSKPPPIGAPTSVIRRAFRKKQDHPLNLSVSSPPGADMVHTVVVPGSKVGGRDEGHSANSSVVKEELFFDGRTSADRPVFVWRYRDDIPPSPLTGGPMSPSSTISATSFVVPDVTGSKYGSSGGSSSSSISQLLPGSQNSKESESVSTTSGGPKSQKKKLRCGDCGKEFSQLRNYRYHRSRHEGSDQFSCTCPVCGKQFNDRGYLSSHMKIHRNAKEYRCEYCTKGFNQRVAYNMHRRIHTGHRPHQCEVCSKSFSRRMLLKQHMRIHTGERPYSCGVCNKAFADRSNMLLHQRLHSGERPYVCEICKKSFSKNHHLKTHMNHHAGIKPYECPRCHARFSQSSNMKTHLKKCSGVPNPTTNQRQHLLRRNPLDIARSAHMQGSQLPSMVVAAAAAAATVNSTTCRESLPALQGASRLLYEQQSLNILSQSLSGNHTSVPQLSPSHTRGQVPIESLLLHLNVSRSRHPSQSSVHSGPPTSPTSTISFPDFQLMLRNAIASGSCSAPGVRPSSNPSSPGSSSTSSSAAITNSGMIIPGMGYSQMSPTSIRRSSAKAHHEPVSPPSLSPMMGLPSNVNLGLGGYGISSKSIGGSIDSSAMPPPSTNGTVLRNIPTPSSLIPPELLSPNSASILRIDTRAMEGFPNVLSPPEKNRHGRLVTSPMLSPRRKPPSPSSLSASGSFIPLSTLESAAIASGLRSSSQQMARLLQTSLREVENPVQHNNSQSSYTSSRLPSIAQQNVLEAMVAGVVNAEHNMNTVSSTSNSTRSRQIPSPHHHHPHQQSSFQLPGDLPILPSLHMNQGNIGQHHSTLASPQSHQILGISHTSPPYSVITSSHMLQHDQQHNMQQTGLPNLRFSTAPSSASASRLNALIANHHADQPQQLELHHQPGQQQHGYHQSLLLSHVNQGSVPSAYSATNSNSGYSAFTHSIIRSRSRSPGMEQPRERNQDYQN